MRKIEEAMCAAVKERRNWKSGNTEVTFINECVKVYLHGHEIYSNHLPTLCEVFSLAGWNTNTTRSRLRALGIGVYQKNWTPMYKNKELESRKWYYV